MNETAQGIVLRIRPLSDSSLIVNWLTQQHGRLNTVAKGARRPKSPFRGVVDLLFEAEFSFARSRHSNLHTLREVKLLDAHSNLQQDIKRLQLMAYATRLLERSTELEYPLPGIHSIFSTLLEHLEIHSTRPALVYAFEIKILNELGLAPPVSDNRLDEYTVQLMEQLSLLSWKAINELNPNRSEVEKLSKFLVEFIQHNLEYLPKGRDQVLTL